MHESLPGRRDARPVADAPIDALLMRVDDLAKGWLLALLEQASLDQAPAILAADLVRDGPHVCDAAVRALADDSDLRLLERGGALEPLVAQAGEFAGASGAEACSRAVDALGSVIWSAIREELPRPDPAQIAELAERLARVIGLIRGAALRRGAPVVGEAPPPAADPSLRPEAAVDPPVRSVVAVDPRARSGSPADPLWTGALRDEILRAERSGAPLSLLLVELADADRVVVVESSGGAVEIFSRFAQAVRGAVRRQDILACETETRAWVISRDTARLAALALGERIASAMRGAAPWRGAPVTVNVGLAVFREDGRDGDALIEAAEQAMFAAAASGNGIR